MRILLVVYDNESHIHYFPIGLGYIAGTLRAHGHDVVIYNQDVHHYPERHLTQYLDKEHFDVVGLNFIGGYYQYKKALRISEAINLSKNRPFYMIGGHGPSPEPAFFLEKTGADVVVIGEGEETVIDLLNAIVEKRSFATVKGVAWREGDKVVVNERRPLIKDIDSLPRPAYDLFPIDHYRLMREPGVSNIDFTMQMISGRGCPFTCNFCYRMDEGFRPRSNEAIIEEMQLLRKDYGITYIFFFDELLMTGVERIENLCNDLISARLNIKWSCSGRLNFARPDLLKLMKKAGCVFINYGIEAMDDRILKTMNKALTVKQIEQGIEATLAAGISPGFNIIFGNIGENRDTLRSGVNFLLKFDDGAQMRTIRPVTPYPGSPLYYHAIDKGLILDCRDFYENKHLNSDLLTVNFTDLSDEEYYDALCEANLTLLKNFSEKKYQSMITQTKRLYYEKDVSFRGFRHT
ncbi:radical SAM protein [Geobacter sp. DSM 9736]|uniref:B12-binding domain-containing radical SAM protein n=1 Tax=Geobacter sp. DSM 9736 TaxID=1277350 RepID=UPI000B51118A|nr:radical SAM protein [Geobacter sp. DSM 9736]SNB47009.1 Radical SAM superfamily enzyme YgiQ, UPF0313 family [Geobacter sp. DSM 9736]